MAMFSKLRSLLLGKPKTGDYRPFPVHHFTHIRDLPLFTFHTIRHMLIDPTIRLGMAMRMAPLCQAEFAFQQGKEWIPGVQADREDVAKFVHKQIKRIWKFELHKILTAQVWGWSAAEVTYRLVDKRVEVDGLLHRHAFDVRALRSDGEVKGVRFDRLGGGVGNVSLRMPKAIWHAYDPEAESPYGTSALRGAHSPWADKWLDGAALDTRRLFAHKDAYGGVDIAYPTGHMNVDGVEIPNRDIAREMGEQLNAGGVTNRPSQYDTNGKPLWEITRATVPANPAHIFDYPKQLDDEMLRGLEIPDDVVTSQGTGAWQGKQVPMQAFFCNADRWLAQVVRVVVTQILEDLVMLNWGKAEEFEVATKPLALQAMEQIKAAEGGDEGAAQQPPGPQQAQPQPAAPQRPPFTAARGRNGDEGATQQQQAQQQSSGPFITVRGPNGKIFQRRNPRFGRQQLGLDEPNMAEMLVGEGAVQAAHLVDAGRRLLMSMHPESNGTTRKRRMRKRKIEVQPTRQELLNHASQSLSLTAEETELLETLTVE